MSEDKEDKTVEEIINEHSYDIEKDCLSLFVLLSLFIVVTLLWL